MTSRLENKDIPLSLEELEETLAYGLDYLDQIHTKRSTGDTTDERSISGYKQNSMTIGRNGEESKRGKRIWQTLTGRKDTDC